MGRYVLSGEAFYTRSRGLHTLRDRPENPVRSARGSPYPSHRMRSRWGRSGGRVEGRYSRSPGRPRGERTATRRAPDPTPVGRGGEIPVQKRHRPPLAKDRVPRERGHCDRLPSDFQKPARETSRYRREARSRRRLRGSCAIAHRPSIRLSPSPPRGLPARARPPEAGENLAPPLVDAEDPGGCVETHRLQVTQKGVDSRCPRSVERRTMSPTFATALTRPPASVSSRPDGLLGASTNVV